MRKLLTVAAALALCATGALAAKPIANPPTQAQLDADKKKVEAEAKAEKAKADAEKK